MTTLLENLKSVVVNGVRVYNMTLHDIKFDNGETSVIFPGNKNVSVRVIQDYAEVKNQFLPCETKQGEKKVIGLPDAQEGIAFIVSGVVLKELPERKDLYAPTQNVEHQVKNELGHTQSVSYFETNL